MSWSVKSIGTKEAVALDVPIQLGAETSVANFIVAQINRIPDPAEPLQWDAATHVRVEAYGHGGQVQKLEVEPFNCVQMPQPKSS